MGGTLANRTAGHDAERTVTPRPTTTAATTIARLTTSRVVVSGNTTTAPTSPSVVSVLAIDFVRPPHEPTRSHSAFSGVGRRSSFPPLARTCRWSQRGTGRGDHLGESIPARWLIT